ncbi:phosphotransferase family protein [Nocardia wallacei]|uniref:phosphotransferase family protein n=1 Tax=Nocardia wallacei TaxID=480035 RepID=UPI00245649C1|nr:aminoglycoside phosphotransferase family protein [Nocardia wallacei]
MSASVVLPDGWAGRVREALAGSPRPELADGELQLLGAGMDSVALLVEWGEGEYVLRLPQDPHGAEGIAREHRLLPELAARLPLPIPRFLFTAPNPLGPGEFCVYPAVPGESLSEEQWHERGLLDRPEIHRRIAESLEGVHAFPVDRARELGIRTWDLRGEFADDLKTIRAEVIPLLDRSDAALLLAAWERYLDDDANFGYRPTLIHADVSLDHLLVTGVEITGLIDFGDVTIGDPDYDLCYLYPEAGHDFVGRVQRCRGTELTPRTEAKLRFWACADPALDVLHAQEHDLPEFRHQRLRVLSEALARYQNR